MMQSNMFKCKVNEVISSLKDAEIGQRGYLIANDSLFIETFNGAEKRSDIAFATPDSILKDNSTQRQNFYHSYIRKI